jgi:hypothetical protein
MGRGFIFTDFSDVIIYSTPPNLSGQSLQYVFFVQKLKLKCKTIKCDFNPFVLVDWNELKLPLTLKL